MVCAPSLSDLNSPGLILLGSRDKERQQPVVIFGLYGIRIDLHRNDNGTVEGPGKPFPSMQAYALRVIEALPTGDPDGVFLRLDVQILFVHPRQFNDGDEIVALLEHINGRIASHAGGGTTQPVAGKPVLEGLLESKKRFERIGIGHDHDALLHWDTKLGGRKFGVALRSRQEPGPQKMARSL